MGLGDIFKIGQFKAEIQQLKNDNQQLYNDNCTMHQQLQELGAFDYYQIREKISTLENEYAQKTVRLKDAYQAEEIASSEQLKQHLSSLENTISDRETKSQEVLARMNELMLQEAKLNKNIKTQTNKLNRSKELVKAINYTFDKYLNYEPS